MENIILLILAIGAVIGGIDLLFGNRFGLGERFEEGFKLLGPTALSMAGIICISPLISLLLEYSLAPLFRLMGLDPAILGGILAIDMGGYQMSLALAENADIGRYAGILVASTLGCTVSFTIPLGVGVIDKNDRPEFFRGMLIGLAVMPLALIVGGLMCGISFSLLIISSLPIIVLSLLLILGLAFIPEKMLGGFSIFAKLIRIISIIGLIIGSVQYITGMELIKNLTPIEDAMSVVSGIGVVMLGSLPTAELLRRLLSSTLKKFGEKHSMKDSSFTALLIGFVSVTPAITMIKDMDKRGKVMNSAFIVCAASTLASHLGFTLNTEPSLMMPLLATKLLGGIIAAVIAFLVSGREVGEKKTAK